MPQLDLVNFFFLIITIIICFLFYFILYQKKILYSWKKFMVVTEKMQLLTSTLTQNVLLALVTVITIQKIYFIFFVELLQKTLLLQKFIKNV